MQPVTVSVMKSHYIPLPLQGFIREASLEEQVQLLLGKWTVFTLGKLGRLYRLTFPISPYWKASSESNL